MSSKESPFRTNFYKEEKPSSPEQLFNDIRRKEIKYLWSHQADILRKYNEKHLESQDVAFELPTGTGKTLIGLLLGEFRRLKYEERVVYLCPTRQLAYQVSGLAKDYGIKTYTLVGPQNDYPKDQYLKYVTKEAIAITTYSGLFNTNPRIKSPEIIILDDAHSSEGYISSLWTVEIDRYETRELYEETLDLIKETLSPNVYRDLISEKLSYGYSDDIDCIPHPLITPYHDAISDFFDQELTNTKNRWPWSMIRNHLHACNFYVSRSTIEIRPMTPPTFAHEPFANANQRIYMSANLGEGGELERITGIPSIERLPIPEGWEKRSTGRRFILFPDLSLSENGTNRLLISLVDLVDRALVITPSKKQAEEVEKIFVEERQNLRILRNENVEDNMGAFVDNDRVALVLTNRYDGLDLPDEDCRLEILYGLPSTTNNQERFFLTRLGADVLLRNRIKTRISQALGRCVRNESDYSIVIMVGDNIGDFCARSENVNGLHPEIQAEIEFGIRNSTRQDIDRFVNLAEIFLSQKDQWGEVDREIIRRRSMKEKKTNQTIAMLERASFHEVNFCKSLWNKNFELAQTNAQKVLDCLHGEELRSYRGWWYYLSGYSAWLKHQITNSSLDMSKIRDMYSRAADTASSVSWLVRLKYITGVIDDEVDSEYQASIAIENIKSEIHSTPLQGKKFETRMSDFKDNISSDDSGKFEAGVAVLGTLLGFDSRRPEGQGVPDGVWSLFGSFHFVFEAKSEQTESGGIGKNDVLQARGHIDWLRTNEEIPDDEEVSAVIISPRRAIYKSALPHTSTVFCLHVSDIRELSDKIVKEYRQLRALFVQENKNDIIQRKLIMEKFNNGKLMPSNIYEWIKSNDIDKLETI